MELISVSLLKCIRLFVGGVFYDFVDFRMCKALETLRGGGVIAWVIEICSILYSTEHNR